MRVERDCRVFQCHDPNWDYSALGMVISGPVLGFEAIRGFYSFYPSAFECFVDEERVRPQPGQVYGGWVTDEIIGPFKGEPGSESW